MVRKTMQTHNQTLQPACLFLSFLLCTYVLGGAEVTFVFSCQSCARWLLKCVLFLRPNLAWNNTELLGQAHFDVTSGHKSLLLLCLLLTLLLMSNSKEDGGAQYRSSCRNYLQKWQSFPSQGDSPVNSHVTKPLPSHQLKNNMLGFGKNVIPRGLWSLWFWFF